MSTGNGILDYRHDELSVSRGTFPSGNMGVPKEPCLWHSPGGKEDSVLDSVLFCSFFRGTICFDVCGLYDTYFCDGPFSETKVQKLSMDWICAGFGRPSGVDSCAGKFCKSSFPGESKATANI